MTDTHTHMPTEQRWRQELARFPIIHIASFMSYLEHGKNPTDFLHAFLAGDRTTTLRYATATDKTGLANGDYAGILPFLPPGSYGSYDAVSAWCARRGLAGRQHETGEPTYNELARALRCALEMTQHIMTSLSLKDSMRLAAAKAVAARVPFDDDVKGDDAGWSL